MKAGRLDQTGDAGVPAPAAARRERSRGGARRRTRLAALLGAIAATVAAVAPAAVVAHPLGNFTINHFAAVRVSPDRISLDVVIDRAEIPAFQEQQRLDVDGDGMLAAAELERERVTACSTLAGDLVLAVDGTALPPGLTAAGLALAPGAGGLPTMRLVCEYEAALATPLAGPSTIVFEDRSFAERIGWREIVVIGDGVTLAGANADSQSPTGDGISRRLTSYPTDLLAQPLDVRSVRFEATPGGPDIAPRSAPDAQPIDVGLPGAPGGTTDIPGVPGVPGGSTEDLAGLIDVSDLNPITILIALAIAFGLGVVHALSPGHGKTIMAAYLVGGRGSTRQAIGLGLAVAVSHTLGVLALAVITIAASSVLPPERLYPILGLASGALVIVIGASLLWSRLRAFQAESGHDHGHGHAHDHGHGDNHDAEHGHPHPHPHSHAHGHDHAAPAGDGISWRGLIALGLSGGLVPSASALILLLGSIAAGLPAYGLVLVASFGLGMAAVLGGLGLALVHARRLVERRPSAARFGRLALPLQLTTASLVVVLGVVLTGQALAQVV
jgi:ABC-type nickel/cobalt efflux system permease component RcnA